MKILSIVDCHKSTVVINNELKENYSIGIQVSTVKICLNLYGLHRIRPAKKHLLSTKYRKARLAFAKPHKS